MELESNWYRSAYSGGEAEAAVANFLMLVDGGNAELLRFKSFWKHNTSTIYSPKDMLTALAEWNVVCSAKMIAHSSLSLIRSPFIMERGGRFITVAEYDENQVRFMDPEIGICEEPTEGFSEQLQGMVIVPDQVCPFELRHSDLKFNQHAKEVRNYVERIREIPKFLSKEECKQLMTQTEPLLSQSQVDIGGLAVTSNMRTSSSGYVPVENGAVVQKITAFAHREFSDSSSIEPLQCVRYKQGQQFKLHFDTHPDNTRKYVRNNTMIIYLNDDFNGGETYFPALDMTIFPEQGKAVIFPLLTETGRIDRFSLHAGLPVSEGQKLICNVWGRKSTYQQ